MHSYLYGKLPGSFDGVWLPNSYFNQTRANLRNKGDLFVPVHRLDYTARLPLHSFPKLWNEFESDKLKKTTSANSFKEGLKDYFLDDLAETVRCGRAFCRDCFPQ